MIALVDYGMGNLRSVANAFQAISEPVLITSSASDLRTAEGIVLPGVGAFVDGMKNLKESGLLPVLEEEVRRRRKPYLGICLGMQFLADDSDEHASGASTHPGFGWIHGRVVQLETGDKRFKVPHMGWNDLQIRQPDPLYNSLPEAPVFYFVHGHHFVPQQESVVSATCTHGIQIAASVQEENIFGVQFHPEKSQQAGLQVLRNFIGYVRNHAQKTADTCTYPA